jgi:Tol biopolymer transport system component
MGTRTKATGALASVALIAALAPATASAGGQRIAFSRSIPNEDEVSVFSICPDGSAERQLSEFGIRDEETAWSADHRRLVYTHYWKNYYGPPSYLDVVWADGTHTRKVPNTVGATEADWAPNGRKLVFARQAMSSGRTALFTIRTDGKNLRRITKYGSFDTPAWSPDGKRILFADRHGIGTVRIDGTHMRRLLPDASNPTWEPDGYRIAFERADNVWVALADGTRVRRVTGGERGGVHPDFSPDGERIAFQGADGGGIWTMTRDGDDAKRVADGWDPAW